MPRWLPGFATLLFSENGTIVQRSHRRLGVHRFDMLSFAPRSYHRGFYNSRPLDLAVSFTAGLKLLQSNVSPLRRVTIDGSPTYIKAGSRARTCVHPVQEPDALPLSYPSISFFILHSSFFIMPDTGFPENTPSERRSAASCGLATSTP